MLLGAVSLRTSQDILTSLIDAALTQMFDLYFFGESTFRVGRSVAFLRWRQEA
jgi:hypothetical protein